MKRNGIRHKFVSPHHQASNGLAERSVGLVKNGIKKMSGGTLETKISCFLLTYRTMPHTTTGSTPAELLMKRRLRTNLDRMKPATSSVVYNNQECQKFHHDKSAQMRSFDEDQAVFAQNFGSGSMWLAGHILERVSPLSFLIRLQDGRLVRRHQDHIRSRRCITEPAPQSPSENNPERIFTELNMPPDMATENNTHPQTPLTHENSPDYEQPDREVSEHTPLALPRRSGRTIRPPNRFSPD